MAKHYSFWLYLMSQSLDCSKTEFYPGILKITSLVRTTYLLLITYLNLLLVRRKLACEYDQMRLTITSFTILNYLQTKSNQMLVLERGENRSTRRKTSRSRVENQQTKPTYDAESGNRTRDTCIGGRLALSLRREPCSGLSSGL